MSDDKLKTLLDAQRRSIQLITARRKLLEKNVLFWEQQQYEGVGEQPFFYSVVDSDGAPGIVIQQDSVSLLQVARNDIIFSSLANVQEDAPFVWTSVGVTLRLIQDATAVTSETIKERLDEASVFSSTLAGLVDGFAPSLQVGFTDKSSGRVLFQSERSAVGEPQQPGGLLPTRGMDLNKQRSAFVQGAPGHGPMGLWSLPKEVVLPTSAALEVTVQSQLVPAAAFQEQPSKTNFRFRAYITLGGYKVTT